MELLEENDEFNLDDEEDDDNNSDISIGEDFEFDELPQRIINYGLFKVTEDKLNYCLDFFSDMKKTLNNNDVVREFKHKINLNTLFGGDCILISQNQFENFYQERKIESVNEEIMNDIIFTIDKDITE